MILEVKRIKAQEVQKQIQNKRDMLDTAPESERESLNEEIKNLKKQLKNIQNAQTLQDLKMSFQDATELLRQNNIPLVLSEEDKAITPHNNEIESLQELICVHKTQYVPIDSRIKSPKEVEGAMTGVSFGDEVYEIPYLRDTVHFTLNGEVTSHMYGNFDGRKYAVLVPFEDMPLQRCKANPVDTYTFNGGLDLTSNSYILCPKGEVEAVQKSNPNVNVIGYEGDFVDGYANAFLSTLGYRKMEIGANTWDVNSRDEQEIGARFVSIMDNNGIKMSSHYYSDERHEEYEYEIIEGIIQRYKVLKNSGKINSEEARKNAEIEIFYCSLDDAGREYLYRRAKEEDFDLPIEVREITDFSNFTLDKLLLDAVQERKEKIDTYLSDLEKIVASEKEENGDIISEMYNEYMRSMEDFSTYFGMQDMNIFIGKINDIIDLDSKPETKMDLYKRLIDIIDEDIKENENSEERYDKKRNKSMIIKAYLKTAIENYPNLQENIFAYLESVDWENYMICEVIRKDIIDVDKMRPGREELCENYIKMLEDAYMQYDPKSEEAKLILLEEMQAKDELKRIQFEDEVGYGIAELNGILPSEEVERLKRERFDSNTGEKIDRKARVERALEEARKQKKVTMQALVRNALGVQGISQGDIVQAEQAEADILKPKEEIER